jgi:predicted nucleotidyltransferase
MNREIFDSIRRLKRELIPNERLILFGSQAQGDARPDSDWDLLVPADKGKSNFGEDFDKYAYPFCELGLKYNILISPKVYTLKEWKARSFTPFYKGVEHDKIEIV